MQREIKIVVTAPCDCTEEQFKEWVMNEIGYSAGISVQNPLYLFDLEADKIEILN